MDNNVRNTFCLIGDVIEKYPKSLIKDLFSEGFDFQNHTQTHSRLDGLTLNKILWEIQTADDTITNLTQNSTAPGFIRPPSEFGVTGISIYSHLLEALQQLNKRALVWGPLSDGTNFGPVSKTPAQIKTVINNVMNNPSWGPMGNGTISLQHTIAVDTEAYPTILQKVKAKGLKPITVFEGIR